MQVGIIPATNVGMRIGKLADHFAQNVSQAVAVRNEWQQLAYLSRNFSQSTPFMAASIEIVALLPPNFVEHLLPFCGGSISAFMPPRLNAPSPTFLAGLRLGIDDAVGVAIASAFGFVEQLGAVEGEGETLHTLDQNFLLALFQIINVDGGDFSRESVRTSPEWARSNRR